MSHPSGEKDVNDRLGFRLDGGVLLEVRFRLLHLEEITEGQTGGSGQSSDGQKTATIQFSEMRRVATRLAGGNMTAIRHGGRLLFLLALDATVCLDYDGVCCDDGGSFSA
jgi:hypothetical protein